MFNLLSQLRNRLIGRKVEHLQESVHLWYEASKEVCEICGQALNNQSAILGDIGEVLDRADRKLFQYRNDATDATRAVRRYNRELANRLTAITKQVYELRNQTASFLIRSQGPGPFAAAPLDPAIRREYHQRALIETGYPARDLHRELDGKLRAIWAEIEIVIQMAENKT